MENKRENLIQKILSKVTPDNIDNKLLFYSTILQRLMDKKENFDININTSVKQRACKKPMKKIKLELLELVSDEDSSSDYIPSEIDSDEDSEDSD